MQRFLLAALAAGALALAAAPAYAQLPPGGYYADGAYYAPASDADQAPARSQDETAYARGVYAYAPGFGPYLRLGGESGWDPNIGSTYNAYPFGDYYSDYGLPPPGPYYYAWSPVGVPIVRVVPYTWPSYGYWRWR